MNMKNKTIRAAALFVGGGAAYVGIELIYRKRSHIAMFFDGGLALLLIDMVCNRFGKIRRLSVFKRGWLGSAIITAIELVSGLAVNKSYRVWNYSRLPLNYKGQICVGYSLLWYLLSIPTIILCGRIGAGNKAG